MKFKTRASVIILSVIVLVESFALYKSFFWLPVFNFQVGADYIRVVGSWIEDAGGGVIGDSPLNTAEIYCYKDRGICLEARSYKSELAKLFVGQLLEYKIVQWSPDEVVAILDGGAGTMEIHFDMKRKVVTLVDSENPELEGARKLPAYAHMGHGRDAKRAAGIWF